MVIPYRQFCQHFLAPLALATHCDIQMLNLLRSYIDGIPLDLASKLLPRRTKFSPGILIHIHLHHASQKRHSDDASTSRAKSTRQARVSRLGFIGILDSLERAVRRLRWREAVTEWGNYYAATNYVDEAMESKEGLVSDLLARITPTPNIVVDLGANTGRFSRLALPLGATVIASDIDPVAVERNYAQVAAGNETHVIPLLLDLTNPPGGGGWENKERPSLFERLPRQTVMALALIHHLAISNNVSLAQLAKFFRGICDHLIIEFVPKSDSQVQRLLTSREDIFPDYNVKGFEHEFAQEFKIIESHPIAFSERRLYLMKAQPTGPE